jgi:hypothetical protein
VIVNLVINARDAVSPGGAIHVEVDREAIAATTPPPDTALAPGEYVRPRVRDNGIGIPKMCSHTCSNRSSRRRKWARAPASGSRSSIASRGMAEGS